MSTTSPDEIKAQAEQLAAEQAGVAADRERLAELQKESAAVRSLNATLRGLAAELPSQATLDALTRQQNAVQALREKRDRLRAALA